MARIGLVLSGGMAKGAYQVGVLEAIEKYFDFSEIECISAASIGALNAYAYATDNLRFARQVWDTAARTGNRYITSLINNSLFVQAIDTLSQKKDVFVPKFYIPLYSLKQNSLSYVDIQKTSRDLRESYLKAAVAMPVFNEAVQIGNFNYFDGAVIDNIPIKPLYTEPLDYIICIYFDNCNYIFEDKYLDHRVIKIVFYNNQRLWPSLRVEKEKIDIMIREGYDKASRFFDFLFVDGKDNFESIYHRKIKLEQNFLSTQTRITGDVVVNNFNRIAKRMVRNNKILVE